MYPIQTGNPFMVQQIVSGSGGFTGSDYGRAVGVVNGNTADNSLALSARFYGERANDYTLQLFDSGTSTVQVATTATLSGNHVTVTLSRTGSALTATAIDVARAINAVPNLGIVARHTGTGQGIMAATALTPLMSGGAEPHFRGQPPSLFLWALPTNSNGGLFFFEQEETILVRQFESSFSNITGVQSVTVLRVNLDEKLQPITEGAIPVFVWDQLTSAKPNIAFSDVGIILHQNQALKVITTSNLPGVVRFDVRKGARYPYL
jgi:hypothetical protein